MSLIERATDFSATIAAQKAKAKAEKQAKLDEAHELRGYEWDTYYQPYAEEQKGLGLDASQNVLERELAKLRMRMGYNQSAGAGTAGWWNLARGNMLNAGAQKQMDLASGWEQWLGGQRAGFMQREDMQAHDLVKQDLAYRQQLELLRVQAELNDPAWWETFGSVVGFGASLWGWAGFPMPNFGGGTSAPGGAAANYNPALPYMT